MKKKILAVALMGTLAFSTTGCLGVISEIANRSTEADAPGNTIEDYIPTGNIEIPEDVADEPPVVDTEDDTEDVTTETTDAGSTEDSNKIIMKDEKTGKDLFTLVTPYYEDTLSEEDKIFSFVEPDGWTVDREYIDSEDGYTETLFFLDDEERATINIGCDVPSGISYFYHPEEFADELEDAAKFTLAKEDLITELNPYGYDIFEYHKTYSDSDMEVLQYIAITYVTDDASFVIELPDEIESSKFDTLDEVVEFLNNNF